MAPPETARKIMKLQSNIEAGKTAQTTDSPAVVHERLVRLDRDHGYSTSKDYEYLYEAAKRQCFVCIVDFYQCRDIAATNVRDGIHGVGARGICYVDAHTKSGFVEQCLKVDLEFIPLRNTPDQERKSPASDGFNFNNQNEQ
jgi:hypothetical protein